MGLDSEHGTNSTFRHNLLNFQSIFLNEVLKSKLKFHLSNEM